MPSTNGVVNFDPTNYSPKVFTLDGGASNNFVYYFEPSGNTTFLQFAARVKGIEKNTSWELISPLVTSTQIKVTTLPDIELTLTRDNLSPITVVKGQGDVNMMRLNISNPLASGPLNTVELRKIKFHTINYKGEYIVPSSAIRSIKIYDDTQTYIEENNIPVTGNSIDLNLSKYIYIQPSTTKGIYVSVDIAGNATSGTFALQISNSSSIIVNMISNTNTKIEKIVDEQGFDIYNLKSDYVVIKGNKFEDVLGNYPNPFNPGIESTSIEYYLDSESNVTIKIYTLTGYLVKILLDNEKRLPGVNTEIWDGRNDYGQIVRNGVYLAVVEAKGSSGTKDGVIKIVVVK